MRVIPPLTVTDAILTSSSATEPHAPAAYNGGTTYAAGAIVSVAADFKIYESLAAGNVGNTPSTSPTWWLILGPTEAAYNGATTYAAGATVSSSSTHRVYESLQAANTGNPLPVAPELTTAWWLDVGPTNKWAMFDYLRNSKTVYASPVTVVLTPGVRIDALAALDLEATSVTVSMVVGASTVYTHTEALVSRRVTGWYDYFFAPFVTKSGFVLLDLPPYYNGVLTVVFTNTGGNVKVGAMLVGSQEYIGDAQYKAESDVLNFSTVTRELDGSAVITQRRNVPKLNITTLVDKVYVNRIRDLRDALNAAPAVYVGIDDDDDSWWEAVLLLGIYKRWVINVDQPARAMCTLELEGL